MRSCIKDELCFLPDLTSLVVRDIDESCRSFSLRRFDSVDKQKYHRIYSYNIYVSLDYKLP